MKKIRSLIFIFAYILFTNTPKGYSQDAGTSWTVKLEANKTFIENKGQFPVAYKDKINGTNVRYGYDDKNTMIYFTSDGVIYCLKKPLKKEEDEERESEEKVYSKESHVKKEAEERIVSYQKDIINYTWVDANPDATIIAQDITSDHFSYSFIDDKDSLKHENFIRGFKKLLYKDLYPNIDVEYTFHPTDGIKYSLILHPGADISKVKMRYSGKMKLKNDGDLHIPTIFGDIVDHAPLAFYADNKSSIIKSVFIISGDNVSFQLDNYDNTKTIIIDPWTQTPLLPTSHAVMECERDGAGNVYIIGGESPMQLLKYSAGGAIQWTYNTPYDTANFWLGTFVVDQTGNSYVTAGSIARLEKVNPSGSVMWTWTPTLFASDEYWNIAFNCDQTKLIVGGTTGSMLALYGAIFDINTSNGSVNSSQIVGYGNMFAIPINIQEVRSISSCRNARYYFLTLDTLGCIDQNLSLCPTNNASIFKINSGYHFSYKMENFRPNNGNGCIMATRANRYFVYTQNGTTVDQRSLSTGAILASASIPGGINTTTLGVHVVGNSGLDIDTCGNVYVGSGNGVYKFDANLNPITSSTTSYHVYDVAVSTGGNVIICGATGDNSVLTRTGYVQSINMGACQPMSLYCCDANICPAGPFCDSDPAVTLVAATPGGVWSGPGITDPNAGTFDPAVAGPGVHTIVYTLLCGSDSTLITVNACANLTACIENNGDVTVSGGTNPYTWQQYNPATTVTITTQAQCQACGYTWLGGTCFSIFPIPATSCTVPASWTTFATGASTVTPPAGHDTISVSDAYNNSLIIYDINTLPICLPCPTLQMSATPSTCGLNNGTATVVATGGSGTYTYTWSTSPPQNTATASNLAGGTYTVTVNDVTCATTGSIVVAGSTALTTLVTNIIDESCGGSNGSATLSVSGGSQPYTFAWSTTPQQTTSALQNVTAGTYTVTVTDADNCTATNSVVIINAGAPVITVSSVVNSTCGLSNGSIALLVSGGAQPYTYSWNTTPVQTTPTATNLPGGTYTVTVTDANNCSALTSVPLTSTQAPVATITGSVNATCGLSNGSATLTVTDGTTPYSYLWNSTPQQTGQNLVNAAGGNYTVTVNDASGCTATASIIIGQTFGPSVQTSSTNEICGQGDGSVSASASGGTGGPYTYAWNTGQTTAAVTGLSSGSYTVTVNDGVCSVTSTVFVANIPGPNAAFTAHPSILTDMDGPVSFLDHSTGSIVNWQWDYGDGTIYGTGNSTSHQYTAIGVYVVTLIVTDMNGCTDTVSDTVKVREIFTLYIPNIFSPNGDGLNDYFTPYGLSVDPNEFEMYIFDRWGNIMFHTTTWYLISAEPWNGTKNNKGTEDDAVLGVYVYRIKAKELDGPKHEYIGHISVMP